jgi:predicted GNAT family acetyltransferase
VALLYLPPGGEDLEIGVQLAPDVWGRGLASEAGHRVAHYGLAHDGVEEVFAVVRPTNTRAAAMARRIGMEWVGETDKYYDLRLHVYRLQAADLDRPLPGQLRDGGRMTGDAESALEVVDVPDRHRYEIVRDGTVLGYAAYQKTDQLIVFTHTEVDPSLEGRGVGSLLVRGALDHVRTLGLAVLPVCPFVQAWLARHRDYADLDYRRPNSHVTD